LSRPGARLVAGVDEAGRGPWAGPVVAAAVILGRSRAALCALPAVFLKDLDDSKRLAPERRERLCHALREAARDGSVVFGIAAASVAEIDRLNILGATHLAMARAVVALRVRPDLALIDGNRAPPLPCAVKTIVRGDGLSLSIAAASVLAKVTRDRLMSRLGARYPDFRWEQNMGYGTQFHREALYRHGPTPHHRLSFDPVRSRQGSLSI